MYKKIDRKKVRRKKQLRIRNKIYGTLEKPRLSLFRSNKNVYAQIIDDMAGNTLAAASSNEPELREEAGNNVEVAKKVGKLLAERAQEKGVKQVIFDRSGYIYHGKVAALADSAREVGLEF